MKELRGRRDAHAKAVQDEGYILKEPEDDAIDHESLKTAWITCLGDYIDHGGLKTAWITCRGDCIDH